MTEVAQALLDYACELEEATEGTGLQYLKDFRDRALGLISSGQADAIISSTINGNTFSSTVTISADKMFIHLSEAIREFKGDTVRITYGVVCGFPH